MSTTKINIAGKEIPLRFGMSVVRAHAKKEGSEITEEEWFAFLIHEAHLCYCSGHKAVPAIEYIGVVEYVESALASRNEERMNAIVAVVDAYNSSVIIQDMMKAGEEDAAKKKAMMTMGPQQTF